MGRATLEQRGRRALLLIIRQENPDLKFYAISPGDILGSKRKTPARAKTRRELCLIRTCLRHDLAANLSATVHGRFQIRWRKLTANFPAAIHRRMNVHVRVTGEQSGLLVGSQSNGPGDPTGRTKCATVKRLEINHYASCIGGCGRTVDVRER